MYSGQQAVTLVVRPHRDSIITTLHIYSTAYTKVNSYHVSILTESKHKTADGVQISISSHRRASEERTFFTLGPNT